MANNKEFKIKNGLISTGDGTFSSGSNQILIAASNGALEMVRGGGGPFIDFKNSTKKPGDLLWVF